MAPVTKPATTANPLRCDQLNWVRIEEVTYEPRATRAAIRADCAETFEECKEEFEGEASTYTLQKCRDDFEICRDEVPDWAREKRSIKGRLMDGDTSYGFSYDQDGGFVYEISKASCERMKASHAPEKVRRLLNKLKQSRGFPDRLIACQLEDFRTYLMESKPSITAKIDDSLQVFLIGEKCFVSEVGGKCEYVKGEEQHSLDVVEGSLGSPVILGAFRALVETVKAVKAEELAKAASQ